MLKGLSGVTTHAHREWLPVIENTQDWAGEAPRVESLLRGQPARARPAHPPARPLHLGPGPRRAEAAPGGAGVPAGGGGAQPGRTRRTDMAVVRIPGRRSDDRRTRPRCARSWPAWASTTSAGSPPHPVPDGASGGRGPGRLRERDRAAQDGGRVRHRRRHRRVAADAEPGRDAGQVRARALARRGRGPLHPARARRLPHPSRRTRRCWPSRSCPGDLIRVPRGTHHWFDLCSERNIRAIRLFQDVSGWTPQYTDTGVDRALRARVPGPVVHSRRGLDRPAGRPGPAPRHRGHDHRRVLRLRRAVPVRPRAPARVPAPAPDGRRRDDLAPSREEHAREKRTGAAVGRPRGPRTRSRPPPPTRPGSWTATASPRP